MGKSEYNNFIDDYEKVRKILKDMYVCDYYKNTDYQKN